MIRIEVADASAGKHPPTTAPTAHPDGESGRGLLLVDTLAARWGWTPRHPVGKTVWAEMPLTTPTSQEAVSPSWLTTGNPSSRSTATACPSPPENSPDSSGSRPGR
jgi:hypothetical protein